MEDEIEMKYNIIELLFCQKTVQSTKEQEKKKVDVPKEVIIVSVFNYFI